MLGGRKSWRGVFDSRENATAGQSKKNQEYGIYESMSTARMAEIGSPVLVFLVWPRRKSTTATEKYYAIADLGEFLEVQAA